MKIQIALFTFLIMGIMFNPGCSEGNGFLQDAYHGQLVPSQVTFGGKIYRNTGEVILKKTVGTSDSYEIVEFIDNIIVNGLSYEVYSITGVDSDTAITIKVLLCNDKGCSDFFYKYVVQG